MMKDDSSISIPDEVLINKIYLIRGKKVMLDSDLAELYGVETKRINEQVKRNNDRFPQDFMFQLTLKEFDDLKSQIATSSWGGRRTLPYAFTEHGVLMLSSVLTSKIAIRVNIHIMRIFVKIRKMVEENNSISVKVELIDQILGKHDEKITLIMEYLRELEKNKRAEKIQQERNRIGYKQRSR